MVNPDPKTGRLCDSGRHVMDPNWDTCPYCDGERRSKQQTGFTEPIQPASSSNRNTTVGNVPPTTGRQTKAMPGQTQGSGRGNDYSGAGDKRKITGILITYSWYPEGQLFEIREGKNFIGAGIKSSETPHEECEILIKSDNRLSAEHALILCRQNRFELVDQKSSNGTFLNREMVPIQGIELPDTAEIETGDTKWTFMKISVSDSASRPVEPKPEPKEDQPSNDKPTYVP